MFVSFANKPRWRIWFWLVYCLLLLIGAVFFEIHIPGIFVLIYVVAFFLLLAVLDSASYLLPGVIRLGFTGREAADAVLAQFPGPAKVQASRVIRWARGVLLVGLLLSPIEINSPAWTFNGRVVEVWLFLFIPLAFYIWMDRTSTFTVDAEGFTANNKKIRWAEITGFEAVTPGIRYGDVVYFHVGGGLSTLPRPFVFEPGTMAALMNEWRSRALALAQEKADKSKKILTETASL